MDSRTERKIEKELGRAEKHHDKANIKEAKGHTHSAERHENRAVKHENRAEFLTHGQNVGVPAGGVSPYTGLNYPFTGATAHPTYGYQRLPRDQKAARFEAKAQEWERRGNLAKAQKNREKALRHRQRAQPGYVPVVQGQQYYTDKANRFDQRAFRYQQLGMAPQAQRYQQRAVRTRTKHGLTGTTMAGTSYQNYGTGYNNNGAYIGPITPLGTVYRGLNHPYTGATQHPTFGYSKLTSAQKAQRFDAKAATWESRGDLLKAQKNREKANRYRQMNQSGYVKPSRAQTYYIDRASNYDQKAIRYQQMGRSDQALRAQQKSHNIRTKHNIPAGAGAFGAVGATGMASGTAGGQYQGLNHPYTGATQHPTFGYSKLTSAQKVQRFDAKAAEWDRRGNLLKAQKNREKANRYRQMSQAGYVKPTRAQTYYIDRASHFDQKAIRYQQSGRSDQALRAQQKAQAIRAKHNIPTGAGATGIAGGMAGAGMTRGMAAPTNQYQGLNYPYTGASQHPTLGYSKLTSDQKAQRFDAKAAEWDRRGDLLKAQKNRDKANRYRQMNQAGYVKPSRAQTYYIDRASRLDQKAIRYQQMGRNDQALQAQQKAQSIRAKHNIPTGAVGATGMTGTRGMTAPSMGQYQGLNFPYSGTSNHPTYGYPRLTHQQKVQRLDAKAAEWERRGNMSKAQKNREKANRYRQVSQPGYVRPNRPQNYYNERALLFDQKAARYQQWEMMPQAQRYQGRSQRIRAKHNIAPVTGSSYPTGTNMSQGAGYMPQRGAMSQGTGYSATPTYQGLNYPYSNTVAHPTYGYQKLPRERKAERFEAKAAEWERRGNMKKATKNREKALRNRQLMQPNYVQPVRPQNYYVDRANQFDQKALQYQQWGMQPQATRYQQRASRVKGKYNLPASSTATSYPPSSGFPGTTSARVV